MHVRLAAESLIGLLMVPPDFLSQGRQPATAHAGDASSDAAFRRHLRNSLKDARENLGDHERWFKAIQACTHLGNSTEFRRARRIGLYVSIGAECPTLPLIITAEAQDKQLYFPVLLPAWMGSLSFARADAGSHWQNNRYGIPEPRPTATEDIRPARHLDLLILPLVGFDKSGNRLGMGAGYYDRCLEFRRHRRHWRRPLLIGLAFDCQQADRIPAQPWDVPLDAVVTESGLRIFKQEN